MGVGVEVGLPSEEEIGSLAGAELDEVLLRLERLGRMVEAAKSAVINQADRQAGVWRMGIAVRRRGCGR